MDGLRPLRVCATADSPALTFRVEKRIVDILSPKYVIFTQIGEEPDLFSISGEAAPRPIPSDFHVRELDCLFSGLLRSASDPHWDSRPFRQIWPVLKAEAMLGAPCAALVLQPESPGAPPCDTSLSYHLTSFFDSLFESLNTPLEKRDLYRRSLDRFLRRLAPPCPVVFEAPLEAAGPADRAGPLGATVAALAADVGALAAERASLLQQISSAAHRASRRTGEIKAQRRHLRVVTDLMFFIDDLNLALVERGG
jgi:hypothetical protein